MMSDNRWRPEGENVVGVLGLFFIEITNSRSPRTSEKPMMAFKACGAHATCWQEIPTCGGWRPRSGGSCPRSREQPGVFGSPYGLGGEGFQSSITSGRNSPVDFAVPQAADDAVFA